MSCLVQRVQDSRSGVEECMEESLMSPIVRYPLFIDI